jgi:NAD(P)-dependent dehydrogenase (short-subunit alcohol dehydrogenase family)
MFSLKGKSAFITGGTSGIGLAVAKRFLAAGAAVAVSDITDGTRVAEEIGAAFVTIDVADEQSVEGALAQAETRLGKLDIVVNNAGVGDIGANIEETGSALSVSLIPDEFEHTQYRGWPITVTAWPLGRKACPPKSLPANYTEDNLDSSEIRSYMQWHF